MYQDDTESALNNPNILPGDNYAANSAVMTQHDDRDHEEMVNHYSINLQSNQPNIK